MVDWRLVLDDNDGQWLFVTQSSWITKNKNFFHCAKIKLKHFSCCGPLISMLIYNAEATMCIKSSHQVGAAWRLLVIVIRGTIDDDCYLSTTHVPINNDNILCRSHSGDESA